MLNYVHFETLITVKEREIPVTVYGWVAKGYPATRIDPPEPSTFEIESIEPDNQEDFECFSEHYKLEELSELDRDRIEELAINH